VWLPFKSIDGTFPSLKKVSLSPFPLNSSLQTLLAPQITFALKLSLWILPVLELINGIRQHISLPSSSFSQQNAFGYPSCCAHSICTILLSSVQIYHNLFTHSPTEGYFGLFPVFAYSEHCFQVLVAVVSLFEIISRDFLTWTLTHYRTDLCWGLPVRIWRKIFSWSCVFWYSRGGCWLQNSAVRKTKTIME
jgi:hypothetical protein